LNSSNVNGGAHTSVPKATGTPPGEFRGLPMPSRHYGNRLLARSQVQSEV
jgi:hypothetical protein